MIGQKKKKGPRPRPERPRIPVAMLIRMFLFGSIAIVACIWALWRHYTVPRPSMLQPVPSSTASEIEIEP